MRMMGPRFSQGLRYGVQGCLARSIKRECTCRKENARLCFPVSEFHPNWCIGATEVENLVGDGEALETALGCDMSKLSVRVP